MILFSNNTNQIIANSINNIFTTNITNDITKQLGIPIIIGRKNKKSYYYFIVL